MAYGCWCNFDENRVSKGIPRDGIDQICHKWAQCNKCIGMDQICDGQFSRNHDRWCSRASFWTQKEKIPKDALRKPISYIILEGDLIDDIEKEDEYNIKITKYDNSFTCNLNEDKCSQSKCLCDSFLIDQLIEELKTGF